MNLLILGALPAGPTGNQESPEQLKRPGRIPVSQTNLREASPPNDLSGFAGFTSMERTGAAP